MKIIADSCRNLVKSVEVYTLVFQGLSMIELNHYLGKEVVPDEQVFPKV